MMQNAQRLTQFEVEAISYKMQIKSVKNNLDLNMVSINSNLDSKPRRQCIEPEKTY